MTKDTTTPAPSEPVAGPVQRPVRPSLAEALQRYWNAAYAEGKEGRDHDTEDGAAGIALRDVMLAVAYEVAAERERTVVAATAVRIAAECIAAAYKDDWAAFDRLSDDFDDAVAAAGKTCAPNDQVERLPAAGRR